MKKRLGRILLAASVCVGMAGAAQANVVITGTRVIYNGNDRETTIKMNNAGAEPALVQVWADKGDAKSRPDTADAPFLIMPPIFRIEAGKAQTVRMTLTDAALPQDRESLFWLNMLDVPPQPKNKDGQNFLQIAIRSRLKIFYRPSGLSGTPEAAAEQVRWQLVAKGKGYALHAVNDSPYYLSFNVAALAWEGHEYKSDGGMIPPRGEADFLLKGMSAKPAGKATIKSESINDFGAPVPHSRALGD